MSSISSEAIAARCPAHSVSPIITSLLIRSSLFCTSPWTFSTPSDPRAPTSAPRLTWLLMIFTAVATAVKIISNQVNRGALVGALGSLGVENVQGEVQKRLDLISNEVMIGETEWAGHLAAMASEEMEDIYPIPECQR